MTDTDLRDISLKLHGKPDKEAKPFSPPLDFLMYRQYCQIKIKPYLKPVILQMNLENTMNRKCEQHRRFRDIGKKEGT